MSFFKKLHISFLLIFQTLQKKIAKKELTIMLYNNMMILPLFTSPHISCGIIQMLCHSDKLISNGARTCFHLFTT